MSRSVMEGFPGAPIRAVVVWVPMLEPDSEPTARRAAALVPDPRARHFYDADRLAGRAVAASLGAPGSIAWDTYLLYPPGVVWADLPPAPAAWMHQLSAQWADPERFRAGDRLIGDLHEAMARLLGSRAA